MQNRLFSELGIPPSAKALLINHDDLGMSCGSNQAFVDLCVRGSIKSGSVMVPCPWFPHVCEIAKRYQEFNIGVHLTLTSEWHGYRWRPLSTNRKSSGLIDVDGYFWKNRKLLRENISRKAAENELRTQIETALSAGIDITHLDCHMGIGFIPELFDIYIKLGYDYKLPVLLLKNIGSVLDLYKLNDVDRSEYVRIINKLFDEDYPLFDRFNISPCFVSSKAQLGYEKLVLEPPKGSLTFLSSHPNKPIDIEQIDPTMHHVRTDEYKIFNQNFNKKWYAENGIILINFRQIRDIIRKKL